MEEEPQVSSSREFNVTLDALNAALSKALMEVTKPLMHSKLRGVLLVYVEEDIDGRNRCKVQSLIPKPFLEDVVHAAETVVRSIREDEHMGPLGT